MAKTSVEVNVTLVHRVWMVTSGYSHTRFDSGLGPISVWEVESIHGTRESAERRVQQVGGWFQVVPWDLGEGVAIMSESPAQ